MRHSSCPADAHGTHWHHCLWGYLAADARLRLLCPSVALQAQEVARMATTNAELEEASQGLRGEVAKQTEENTRLAQTSRELATDVSKLNAVVGIVGCARPPRCTPVGRCLLQHNVIVMSPLLAASVQRGRESSARRFVWRRGAP